MNVKRAKKAVPNVTVTRNYYYSVVCPHCRTECRGGDIGIDVLRLKCFSCKQPIDLDWDNVLPH